MLINLERMKHKTIFLDEPTRKFLDSIKEERKKLQLSTRQAAAGLRPA